MYVNHSEGWSHGSSHIGDSETYRSRVRKSLLENIKYTLTSSPTHSRFASGRSSGPGGVNLLLTPIVKNHISSAKIQNQPLPLHLEGNIESKD